MWVLFCEIRIQTIGFLYLRSSVYGYKFASLGICLNVWITQLLRCIVCLGERGDMESRTYCVYGLFFFIHQYWIEIRLYQLILDMAKLYLWSEIWDLLSNRRKCHTRLGFEPWPLLYCIAQWPGTLTVTPTRFTLDTQAWVQTPVLSEIFCSFRAKHRFLAVNRISSCWKIGLNYMFIYAIKKGKLCRLFSQP